MEDPVRARPLTFDPVLCAGDITVEDPLRVRPLTLCSVQGTSRWRTTFDPVLCAGDITVEDLLAVMPFGGTFDLVQLSGATLLSAFEHAVRRHGQSTGEFLQVSGEPPALRDIPQ